MVCSAPCKRGDPNLHHVSPNSAHAIRAAGNQEGKQPFSKFAWPMQRTNRATTPDFYDSRCITHYEPPSPAAPFTSPLYHHSLNARISGSAKWHITISRKMTIWHPHSHSVRLSSAQALSSPEEKAANRQHPSTCKCRRAHAALSTQAPPHAPAHACRAFIIRIPRQSSAISRQKNLQAFGPLASFTFRRISPRVWRALRKRAKVPSTTFR